ncbi:MAG TPA: rhodanese-like domain-containing protein [Bacteroidales bacterium]|nr:rhodanese-like domain-containing protein [Bacteroidales bacterium]
MKKKIFQILTIAMVVMIAACSGVYENGEELAAAIKDKITEISADELKAKIDNGEDFLLLDVRQASEFQNASIPGSINIPRGTLEFVIRNDNFWEEKFLNTPENGQEIIVYCKAGDRGALSAFALQQLGFTNVRYLKGGILRWDTDIDKSSPKKSSGGGCGN